MKTILLIALTACSLVSVSATANNMVLRKAEFHTQFDAFERFNAHRQQDGIALSWSFSSSSEISHSIIEKSYDGNYFEVVDRVSSGAKGVTRYFDSNIYPGFIYYRITAVFSNGSTVSSPIDVVRFVSKK